MIEAALKVSSRIVVQIGDESVCLSPDEARRLIAELQAALPETKPAPVTLIAQESCVA